MFRHILSLVMYVASCLCLLVGILFLILTCLQVSSQASLMLGVTPLALQATRLLPSGLMFVGVIPSPLGGVFRTDFLIVGAIALVIARIAKMIAKALS